METEKTEKTEKTDKTGFYSVKTVVKIIAAAAVLIYLLSGVYIINNNEIGIVKRFGRMVPQLSSPGMHYRFPYPVDKLIKLDVTTIKRINVGAYIRDGKIVRDPDMTEMQRLSGDKNIVIVDMTLQYKVREPGKYLFSSINPDQVVSNAASSVLLEIIAGLYVDDILTKSKTFIQGQVMEMAQDVLDEYDIGVDIVAINTKDIKPPAEVIGAFNDVTAARSDRDRYINQAESYREDNIPRARGEAEKLLREAESYKIETVNRALGEIEGFLKVQKEYNKARSVTRTRMYLDTIEQILPRTKLFIVDKYDAKNPLEMKFINP